MFLIMFRFLNVLELHLDQCIFVTACGISALTDLLPVMRVVSLLLLLNRPFDFEVELCMIVVYNLCPQSLELGLLLLIVWIQTIESSDPLVHAYKHIQYKSFILRINLQVFVRCQT